MLGMAESLDKSEERECETRKGHDSYIMAH